mmetsp:Transcript_7507/g.14132  ORF Transcript_7507/g.14132 Transcript_7507/m.14132 type:complete len:328 (-) Transcript_7507:1258-2241(-)
MCPKIHSMAASALLLVARAARRHPFSPNPMDTSWATTPSSTAATAAPAPGGDTVAPTLSTSSGMVVSPSAAGLARRNSRSSVPGTSSNTSNFLGCHNASVVYRCAWTTKKGGIEARAWEVVAGLTAPPKAGLRKSATDWSTAHASRHAASDTRGTTALPASAASSGAVAPPLLPSSLSVCMPLSLPSFWTLARFSACAALPASTSTWFTALSNGMVKRSTALPASCLYRTVPETVHVSFVCVVNSNAEDKGPKPQRGSNAYRSGAAANSARDTILRRCSRYSTASCCLPLQNSKWPFPTHALNICGRTSAPEPSVAVGSLARWGGTA